MDEDLEYNAPINKVLDAQTDLIVEILARQTVLTNIIFDYLAKAQGVDVESLKSRLDFEKDEIRTQLSGYVFAKFGPDFDQQT